MKPVAPRHPGQLAPYAALMFGLFVILKSDGAIPVQRTGVVSLSLTVSAEEHALNGTTEAKAAGVLLITPAVPDVVNVNPVVTNPPVRRLMPKI